jgi:hypothetical protein
MEFHACGLRISLMFLPVAEQLSAGFSSVVGVCF